MYHSLNAGRLRHYVELERLSTETDDYGQPIGYESVFDAWAEVKSASGSQIVDYGTTMTNSMVTVLMYYDDRATNDMNLVFEGVNYSVEHVKPDELRKSMILTCKVTKK